ncbi:MAG: dihydrolipoyl dehydrogenase [Caldicoprobacterales bacterium]
MDHKFDYDLLVLGGGPAGYVAAIRASQLGLRVGLVEKNRLGGVCLNVGCIPSKSLISQASIFRSIPDLEGFGLKVDKQGFDYRQVFKKSRKAADILSKGISYLMKKNNIRVFEAEGVLSIANELLLSSGERVTGKNIIIATGSSPRQVAAFPFDGQYVLSSTDALMLEKLPESMLILGAGAIGVEFAYIMNAFGVKVHLLELQDRILPLEDEDISSQLARSLKRSGIKLLTGARALSLEKNEGKLLVEIEDKKGRELSLTVDKLLVAVGREPNTKDIGLESLDIKTEKGYIVTGDYYETSHPGIYAVGDVVNSPLLAHVASKEGEIVAEHIAGKKPAKRINALEIPSAVYCEPQLASFGYSEWRARAEAIPYEKVSFPYRGNGKAVAIEKPDGFVKILFDPETKEIIGGHCIGVDATELIHQILLAKRGALSPTIVADMVHAHPTISETIMEGMKAIEGRAIHG